MLTWGTQGITEDSTGSYFGRVSMVTENFLWKVQSSGWEIEEPERMSSFLVNHSCGQAISFSE